MTTNNEISFTQVYAGNILEAGMVQSLLESADINAFLKDEIMGTLQPWWAAGGGAGAVKVMVSTADLESARLIVEEYENGFRDQ